MCKLVFVVGTGRCGTSSTARVLHQSGMACMGHSFDSPDSFNPKGYWEDEGTRLFLHKLLCGDVEGFRNALQQYHEQHGCAKKAIGYKHPIMASVYREYWEVLDPYRVYWCCRPEEATAQSIIRFRRFHNRPNPELDIPIAANFLRGRLEQLEKSLSDLPFVRKIDFSEYRTDKWILAALRR